MSSNKSSFINNLEEAVSSYEKYCDGYGNPGASGRNYFIGFVLGTGVCKQELRHDGSETLDEINAFDKAEVSTADLGQINMTVVSSFCGPQGIIWGYDIAKADGLHKYRTYGSNTVKDGRNKVGIYSAKPLLEATSRLFGTVKEKRFPLIPGSHVPCACKHFESIGPKRIYAAFAIAIPENRSESACLLMEDKGWLPFNQDEKASGEYKSMIMNILTRSVIEVGQNQNVRYKEIFAEMVDIEVREGYVGSALVAVPYFTLAQKAIPDGNFELLSKMTLDEWEKSAQLLLSLGKHF